MNEEDKKNKMAEWGKIIEKSTIGAILKPKSNNNIKKVKKASEIAKLKKISDKDKGTWNDPEKQKNKPLAATQNIQVNEIKENENDYHIIKGQKTESGLPLADIKIKSLTYGRKLEDVNKPIKKKIYTLPTPKKQKKSQYQNDEYFTEDEKRQLFEDYGYDADAYED